MFSFFGQTNWQYVKSSNFRYSEKPTSIKVTSDNYGDPRHNYEISWNASLSDRITIDQTLEIELTWIGTLYTAAPLPYDPSVLKRYSASLGDDKNAGINPNNPEIQPICAAIVGK